MPSCKRIFMNERIAMLQGGLVSVTFRRLSVADVVALLAKSRLRGIEWGGDVHVPHGDLRRAREVRSMSASEGLLICSYGSYYRAGESEAEGLSFRAVLDSAKELGAPVIRIWAGKRGSSDANGDYRRIVAEDSLRIAGMAGREGIKVAFELHGNTLTDTRESATRLLKDANHENLFCYWQPQPQVPHEQRLEMLRDIGRKLSHIHAYHWLMESGKLARYPLAGGETEWSDYLAAAASIPGDRFVLLEFVENDSPDNFLRDAATLAGWLSRAVSHD